MGADMLVAFVAIEKGKKPDFKAGREVADKDDKDRIDDLEVAWTDFHREAAKVEFRGAEMLITGGLSWGDSPTGLFDSIRELDLQVLEAMGFETSGSNAITIVLGP